MTKRKTDRYVRRGGPVPTIYPGTLQGLTQALKDCVSASRLMTGTTFQLISVQGTGRQTIGLFQGGERTWQPDSEAISD